MKYDLKPLMPILGRDTPMEPWRLDLFSHYNKDSVLYRYYGIRSYYSECIPYNDNMAHLINAIKEPKLEDMVYVGMLVAASRDGETWYPAIIKNAIPTYDSTIDKNTYEVESLSGFYRVPFIDYHCNHFK